MLCVYVLFVFNCVLLDWIGPIGGFVVVVVDVVWAVLLCLLIMLIQG